MNENLNLKLYVLESGGYNRLKSITNDDRNICGTRQYNMCYEIYIIHSRQQQNWCCRLHYICLGPTSCFHEVNSDSFNDLLSNNSLRIQNEEVAVELLAHFVLIVTLPTGCLLEKQLILPLRYLAFHLLAVVGISLIESIRDMLTD